MNILKSQILKAQMGFYFRVELLYRNVNIGLIAITTNVVAIVQLTIWSFN